MEIMTANELADLLRIHVRTIYKLAEKGIIPGNKIGRSWRFNRSDICELISNKKGIILSTNEASHSLKRSRD